MAAKNIRSELGIAGRSEQEASGERSSGKNKKKRALQSTGGGQASNGSSRELTSKISRHQDELASLEIKIAILSRELKRPAGTHQAVRQSAAAEYRVLKQKLAKLDQRRCVLLEFLAAHSTVLQSDGPAQRKGGKKLRTDSAARKANIRRAQIRAGTPPPSGRRRATLIS